MLVSYYWNSAVVNSYKWMSLKVEFEEKKNHFNEMDTNSCKYNENK